MAMSSGETRPARRSSRLVKGTTEHKPANMAGSGLMAILMHPLNVLLVTFPLGILSHMLEWGQVTTFWFNFCALVPLAKILGDATEELAAGLKNDMLAGLLNATFGNAVEMVIMVQTLRKDHVDVVKATLLGSVLSNLLLVLGMSFFFGGIMSSNKKKIMLSNAAATAEARKSATQMRLTNTVDSPDCETYTEFDNEKVQTFSVMSALVNTSMLLLSCLSFSLVTVFASHTSEDGNSVMETSVLLPVSRMCSGIIMVAYGAYIYFQLVTHREAMAEDSGGDDATEDEEPALSIPTAVIVMLVTTCVVAFSSELLVKSLDEVAEAIGNKHFIGIILLPIVGNACEHASAIRFAIMDKCGLSIGIAVGSSTQMSLFVVPFAVLCGWVLDKEMDLNFGSLNTTVMSISVVVVLSVVVDGTANWLQGYMLMSAYFVVCVLYWHLPQ